MSDSSRNLSLKDSITQHSERKWKILFGVSGTGLLDKSIHDLSSVFTKQSKPCTILLHQLQDKRVVSKDCFDQLKITKLTTKHSSSSQQTARKRFNFLILDLNASLSLDILVNSVANLEPFSILLFVLPTKAKYRQQPALLHILTNIFTITNSFLFHSFEQFSQQTRTLTKSKFSFPPFKTTTKEIEAILAQHSNTAILNTLLPILTNPSQLLSKNPELANGILSSYAAASWTTASKLESLRKFLILYTNLTTHSPLNSSSPLTQPPPTTLLLTSPVLSESLRHVLLAFLLAASVPLGYAHSVLLSSSPHRAHSIFSLVSVLLDTLGYTSPTHYSATTAPAAADGSEQDELVSRFDFYHSIRQSMEFLPVQMACQLGLCDLCVVLDSDVLISDSDFAVSSAEQTIDSSSALEETIRSLLTSSDPKPEQPPAIPSTAWERIQALRKVDVSVVSIDAGGPDGVSIESLRELTELISAKRTKQRTEKAIGVVSTGEADREGEDDGMADSSMKLMEKIASQTESFAAVASQRQAVSTVALSNLPQFTPSDPLLAALQGVFMFSFDLLQSPSLLLDLHFTPPPSLSTLHLITPASHVFLTQSPLLSLPTSTASSAPLVLTDPGQIWQKARQQDAVVSSVHAILTHSRRHQTADTLKLLFSPQSTSAGALQSRTLVFALIGATQHRSSQSASQQVMAVVLVQLMPLDETLRTTLPVPPAHHDSLVAVVRHISSHPSMLQTGYGKETMRQLSLFFAGKLFDAMQSSLVDIASDTLPFIVPASHVRPPPVFTLLSTVPLTDTFSSQHASSDWAVPLTPTAAEGVVQFMRCCEFTPVLVRPSPRHTHSARTEWELILVKGVMEKQEEDDDDDAEFAIISQKQKGGEDEWIVTASSVFCSTLLTQLSFPSLPVSPQLAVTLLDSSLDPHAAHFTGLPIANPRPTPLSVTKLSPHDLHRLYQTAQGSIPLPFVTDLIPVVTTQLLSAAIPTPITQQEALILVSVGLKGWSVDETAKVYGLHPSQVRGKIRVACQRVWEWYEAENKDELQNDEEEPTPLILVHHPAPISEDHQPPMLEKQKRPFIERDPNSKQSSKKSKKIKH